MSEYIAPLGDMQLVLHELADSSKLAQLPGYEEATPDVVDAILEEAAKFASGVLSPLNVIGDQQGARWQDGNVITAPGWREAYEQFVSSGWNALSANPDHGGQGLPRAVSAIVEEMWNAANMSFTLCPMLTRGATEAIELRGSDTLQRTYLPKMVSGEWAGTMNLTEPQAGSDLAAVRTRAVPQGDGTYRLHGQKIFITYGEHDLTENIIHLVLARTPDAPEGVKGISLFVVPKFLVNADGSIGPRNDVRCVSIEHKLGIHASPTATLAYGDKEGAVGYLVGEENRGLEYMFIMMNAARYSVGLEGIGLAERAYQRARDYARDRIQGTEVGVRGGSKVAIIRHADVRRMLMLMKSQTEAMRALAAVVAAAMDTARLHPDATERQRNQAFTDLMIPVVKGWSTETGFEVASLGVQIHGGMGFIEETGAAQYLRDARITTIYEGTTGIQANDLIGRKIAREKGQTISQVIEIMRALERELESRKTEPFDAIRKPFGAGIRALGECAQYIVGNYAANPSLASVGAVPFLKLLGVVAGGWQMARAALIAQQHLDAGGKDAEFYRAKIVTARFYAEHVLSQAPALAYVVVNGAESAFAIADEQL
jgi:acyl-CoA dehydrogenase